MKDNDLDAVIKGAGDKPWFFWCNPGDTHAPWWKHVQSKLTNPKDKNSAPNEKTHAKSLWPILSGNADALADRRTIMTETNNSLMSQVGIRGDGTMARAVCDGRFYYIGNLIQTKTELPEEKAVNIGTGDGKYGGPGQQYAIDLHDETVRQKDKQPLPYELLRQLCMGDAPKEELYDLGIDPWAVKNLIADPARADALARMRKEFAAWRQSTGDREVHPKTIQRRTTK